MIDTDQRGQEKWQEIVKDFQRDPESDFWTDFERGFIDNSARAHYSTFSPKQKSIVGRLHEKLVRG